MVLHCCSNLNARGLRFWKSHSSATSFENHRKMSDTAENQQQQTIDFFSEEQRKFLKVVFKRTKSKLCACLKQCSRCAQESPRMARKNFFHLLKRTVLEECADVIEKSETPQSCLERVLSCGGDHLADVAKDMQEKGLIEAVMQEADLKVAKITTNPHLNLQKFIDEVFVIMDKFAEAKKKPELASPPPGSAEKTPAR